MSLICLFFFFFTAPPTTEIYTLSLHDALPISDRVSVCGTTDSLSSAGTQPLECCATGGGPSMSDRAIRYGRSEEHTSELQSPYDLVCRLLLEKKKKHMSRQRNTQNNKIECCVQ